MSDQPKGDSAAESRGTDRLDAAHPLSAQTMQVDYVPVPDRYITAERHGGRPVWRVRFELASDPSMCFGLDINGEVVLGRGEGRPGASFDLSLYAAADLGVSRRHLLLRPTASKLFALDLGSTNGTQRNGQRLGVNTPQPLRDLDTLSLGGLQLVVRFVQRPHGKSSPLRRQADIADALIEIADSITSQVELDEILNQISENARSLTFAGEVGIWLVDEQTGELFLEAAQGIDDEAIKRLRIPVSGDSQAAQVIRSGRPLHATRKKEGPPVKVKTGYLVEAVIYVPLIIGGAAFGAIMAAHREPSKEFSERDQKLIAAIAQFASIAVQNSRMLGVADMALQKRAIDLAALNDLARAVSSSLELDHVVEVLREQIGKHWEHDEVSLWLVDEPGTEPRLYKGSNGSRPKSAPPQGDMLPRLVAMVASSGEPLAGDGRQPWSGKASDRNATVIAGPGAMMGVPLRVTGHVVGVLALYRHKGARFSDSDVDRLESFANPVATAVHNAQLFAESERERATVRALAQTFPHPLLLIDEVGQVYISNRPAERLMQSNSGKALEAIKETLGKTERVELGERSYLATAQYEQGIGTIVIMQDITDSRRAEEALRESEQRYRTLIETSPDAIDVTDLKGVIGVCNWQAANLFGLEGPEEAIAKNVLDFIAPEDRARARDNLGRILVEGSVRNVEYTLLKKDGTRFPVEVNASLLKDVSDQPVELIGVVRDITHIKKLEQARADFVHALTHDLKGPLTAIRGWAELLHRVAPGSPEYDKFTQRIVEGTQALSAMIDQLLDVFTSDGGLHLKLTACRVEEVVSRVVRDLDGAAVQKNMKLRLNIQGNPYAVKADPMRLYRIMINLVENAIKYAPEDTIVLIDLKFGSELTLAVRDHGPGIPEEDLPYVFEQYYRGRQVDGGKAGIGLGLATVRALVSAHNGTIRAQNTKDGGAEFTITLPGKIRIEESIPAADMALAG